MKIEPVIVVDSREQTPWKFANLPSEPGSLTTGDYSVKGSEHLIAVERKSLPDLLACCGRERVRNLRELKRLRAYRFRCLVIEASYADLECGKWRSQVKPSAVWGSLAGWQCQYSLPVMLVGTHKAGAEFCERYLFQAARRIVQENSAVGVAAECVA
ncbi:MAG: hypothetical protein O7D91_10855 [Planctomycetota bacterium]|nr:hypothetical protein [Planctomycetota bacterium]